VKDCGQAAFLPSLARAGLCLMIEEPLTLVLVHGTWAENAPWTQETSPLVLALRKEFRSIQKVERIDWSGKNSFKARLDARDKITALLSAIPSGEKAIICAHSHGGGAVCYALQEQPELANATKGLIFLATPFCTYRLLPTWRLLLDGLYSPLIFGFFVLYILLFKSAGALISEALGVRDPWDYLAFMSLLIPLYCVTAVVCSELALRALIFFNRVKLRLSSRLLCASIRTSRLISCELPPASRAIFIRLSGDEASVGLNFAQAVTWITITVNVVFNRVFGALVKPLRVTRIRRPIWDRVLFGLFIVWFTFSITVIAEKMNETALAASSYDHSLLYLENMVDFIAEMTAITTLSLPLVLFLVSVVLFSLNWLLSCLFGRLPFLSGGVLQPAVEATPPGIWLFDHVTWRSYGSSRQKLLWRHSNPYGEPKIIAAIVAWLRQQT
jgi:pimeloyl-ACP methyl ester carboxylesterase